MVAITPFTLILSILSGVLVQAIPQHQQRDDPICVAQTTITVTAPAVSDPTTIPDANEQKAAGISGNGANAEVTVTRTVTVIRTIDGVPEQTSDNGVTETVTVTSTETSTVTIQTPPETKISDPTTEPKESKSPEPAAPSPPVVHPQFDSGTKPVPYGNSSLHPSNSSSGSPHVPVPVLPKPSSTVGIQPSSEYALPAPSGYENSIYFTNWSVTLCPSFLSPSN